ncbi:MAG: hypothetical protein GX076_06570 [Clostridiales bacterium]|nr:hypothetical protein [Clostridiales bacterium]
MSLLANTIKDGFIKALKTTATLMKVVLPVYAIVVLLKYSPVMPLLEQLFQSSMGIYNLPGEAVVPLIAGVFTDEYGTIAATRQFDFDSLQITTIAMICLVFHSIPVEYALSRKIGLPAGKLVLYRLIMAIIIGLITAWIGGLFL